MAQHICRDAAGNSLSWTVIFRPSDLGAYQYLMVKRRAEYVPLLGYSCFLPGALMAESSAGRVCPCSLSTDMIQCACGQANRNENTLTVLLNAASHLKEPYAGIKSGKAPVWYKQKLCYRWKEICTAGFPIVKQQGLLTERWPEWLIETMGYEDRDYCARKSVQHTGMKATVFCIPIHRNGRW